MMEDETNVREARDRLRDLMFSQLTTAQRRAIAKELLRIKKAFEEPGSPGHENWYPVHCKAVELWNALIDLHEPKEKT